MFAGRCTVWCGIRRTTLPDGFDPAIIAVADLTSSAPFFNGDDAAVLWWDGVTMDVIGNLGEDPGSYSITSAATTQSAC